MIKKILQFLFLLLLFFEVSVGCIPPTTLSWRLVNEKNQPTSPLLELLAELNLNHNGTMEDITNKTQQSWLRKQKERWEIQEERVITDNTIRLLNCLGFFEEIAPLHKEYINVCILGATLPSFRLRLHYLLEQWKKGVKFEHLFFLCGTRPLTHPDERDAWDSSEETPKTEAEMMRWVFDRADIPSEWRAIATFIVTPHQWQSDGSYRRANTQDTLIEWLKENSIEGRTLMISHQPYIGYQAAVVEKNLPRNLCVETCGPKAKSLDPLEVYLDSLARWLFVIRECQDASGKE